MEFQKEQVKCIQISATSNAKVTSSFICIDELNHPSDIRMPRYLIDAFLSHKSTWIPDSKGGEPNHRDEKEPK